MLYLIGHRGVGKTTLLKKLPKSFKKIDLDDYIVEKKGKTISEIFNFSGEECFRSIELELLQEIQKMDVDVVSLGAGALLSKILKKENDLFVWVRRVSDEEGRVFVDRPRLNKNENPINEFKERVVERNQLYKNFSDFELNIGENEVELSTQILTDVLLGNNNKFKGWLTYGLDKNLFLDTKLEYRTDLTPAVEILSRINKGDLVSIRSKASKEFYSNVLKKGVLVDVPIEMEKDFDISDLDKERVFLSSHELLSEDEVKKINDKGFHLKWAPVVQKFSDLIKFHQLKSKYDMSFLPRDESSSRWQWYRVLNYKNNRINFFRFSQGSDQSQPFWYQIHSSVDSSFDKKGCVIGSPIEHSFSPSFHREFFKGCYFPIEISQEELSLEVLNFLSELGIKHYSVTSPLKDKTGWLLNVEKPVNTLYNKDSKFLTANTDLISMAALVEKVRGKRVCIWGAGAIGKQFCEMLPSATLFSIREQGDTEVIQEFDVLIWSAGSKRTFPNFKKHPVEVYDIDYRDNSPAKEYAVDQSLKYESGLEFFNIQACKQQEWWLSQSLI